MAIDSSLFSIAEEHREARADARQKALARELVEPYSDSKKLFGAIRSYLLQCCDAEDLRSSHNDILTKLHLNVAASTIHVGTKDDAAKNFRRTPDRPHLVRRDGAWFDFSFTLTTNSGKIEVLGCNAEIRFTGGINDTQARWLRFDLNLDGHVNDDERAMRAHMHAGNDDWLMPAPAFRPFELLDLLVFGLGASGDRKPRATT